MGFVKRKVDMESNKCNHKWVHYPTYKQCILCGGMIISPELSRINGFISDEDDYDNTCPYHEDEEGHTDVPPLNDTHD